MMNLLLIVGKNLLLVTGTLFGLFLLFTLLARALGRHNLFYTLNKEGNAKVVVHNEAFASAIMNYAGFYFDKRWNVIQGKRREKLTLAEAQAKGYTWDGKKRRREDRFYRYFIGGGLEWIGLWPFFMIFTCRFRWMSLVEGKEVAHDELLDYIYLKAATYVATIEGAETDGMVPLDVKLYLTIRIINPYKALFRAHQWLEFTVNRIGPYIRQFVATKKFEDLVAEKQAMFPGNPLFDFLRMKEELTEKDIRYLETDGYSEKAIGDLKRSGKGILGILKEIYGVDIIGIEFKSFTPAGVGREDYEKSAAKGWLAGKDAEKIKILAEAEKGRIDVIYSAVKKYGDLGLFIQATETIKEAGKGPSNLVIFPFGALKDILQGWTGKKEREDKK